MEQQIVRPKRHHRCAGERPGLAAVAVIRVSGPGARDVLEALCGGVAPSPRMPPCATSRPREREARSRPRALVPGAGELHRRGHGRAPAAWQPRRDPRRARCAARPPRHAACRARRVRPPRVRERQARSHRGRGPRRSGQCRDRGAAASGAGAVGRLAAAALRRLARGAAPRAGAGRGRARLRRRRRRGDRRLGQGRRHRRIAARESIARHLADGIAASVLRDGFRIVIAGPPNAGKSSS